MRGIVERFFGNINVYIDTGMEALTKSMHTDTVYVHENSGICVERDRADPDVCVDRYSHL